MGTGLSGPITWREKTRCRTMSLVRNFSMVYTYISRLENARNRVLGLFIFLRWGGGGWWNLRGGWWNLRGGMPKNMASKVGPTEKNVVFKEGGGVTKKIAFKSSSDNICNNGNISARRPKIAFLRFWKFNFPRVECPRTLRTLRTQAADNISDPLLSEI